MAADVIVVGAGMAGLVCAQRLHQVGYQISILEKSRGLGGRMATRRAEGVPIDHGARYIQPQTPRLQQLVAQLVNQGILDTWRPRGFHLAPSGALLAKKLDMPYYVAPGGMSAVGKAIAGDLSILRQQRAIALTPATDHWQIQVTRAEAEAAAEQSARAVVLAIPAPQAVPLLAPLPSQAPLKPLVSDLAAVTYTPCITVMAQYAPPSSQTTGTCLPEPMEPWQIEGHPETPFFWLGLDSSKRQAPGLNVVMHSSVSFAIAHLDAPNLQMAGEALLAEAGAQIAPWLAAPLRWQVHRWRYALVEKPCPRGILSTDMPLPLVACGDWCGHQNLDSALDAGWQAAAAVNEMLDRRSLADELSF